MLLIVIAIAGLVFGEDAAQGAIEDQVSDLMGKQSADMLQNVIHSAANQSSGILASIVGIVALIVTASGVFGEMQTALNAIWQAQPSGTTVSRLVRARLVSLGLVAALGFLLLTSLVITAALSALSTFITGGLPFFVVILEILNFLISFSMLVVLFSAIYKILPDFPLKWKDVLVGATFTAFLFTIGKSLIGFYLGSGSIATSYGAAGGLLILLLWVYYSAQIFLLGAEFTKAFASNYGSLRRTDGISGLENGQQMRGQAP